MAKEKIPDNFKLVDKISPCLFVKQNILYAYYITKKNVLFFEIDSLDKAIDVYLSDVCAKDRNIFKMIIFSRMEDIAPSISEANIFYKVQDKLDKRLKSLISDESQKEQVNKYFIIDSCDTDEIESILYDFLTGYAHIYNTIKWDIVFPEGTGDIFVEITMLSSSSFFERVIARTKQTKRLLNVSTIQRITGNAQWFYIAWENEALKFTNRGDITSA